ncbi:hypothetical protein [Pseudorhodoferax sp.]|uniref:hypothetical protein n=1 Tax=Pseudorhodoferax sp. TaxID=1993553 RepID=UPI0039E43DE2
MQSSHQRHIPPSLLDVLLQELVLRFDRRGANSVGRTFRGLLRHAVHMPPSTDRDIVQAKPSRHGTARPLRNRRARMEAALQRLYGRRMQLAFQQQRGA